MKLRTVPVVYCFLFALVVIASCKKSPNNNPFGNARIATADVTHSGAITHYHFTYDTYNNVDSVSIIGAGTATGFNGYYKYNYVGSSYTITDQTNFTYTVYASTSGLLLKILVADTISYLYTNNVLTEMVTYTTSLTPPYHSNVGTYYTWLNGDVTNAITGSQNNAYSYNTAKNGQPGDALRIKDFLRFGKSAIKTIHLPVSLAYNSTQGYNYIYTYDDKGRISQFTEAFYDTNLSFADTTTYVYSYY